MLLTQKEEEALSLLELDIDLEELVNSHILNSFQSFKHFETQIHNISHKYLGLKKELEELERRLATTTIYRQDGRIKDEFIRSYNTIRLLRQSGGKSFRSVRVVVTNT